MWLFNRKPKQVELVVTADMLDAASKVIESFDACVAMPDDFACVLYAAMLQRDPSAFSAGSAATALILRSGPMERRIF